jgi:hypothetical protein
MISNLVRDIVRKVFLCVLMFASASVPAFAAECPGNPDALGTSRVLAISPVVPENLIRADSRHEAESAHHST